MKRVQCNQEITIENNFLSKLKSLLGMRRDFNLEKTLEKFKELF